MAGREHVAPGVPATFYSTTKMDAERVEKLIGIVRGHIYLYDLCHPQYKNAIFKSAIWETIGRELMESGEAVRNKWKTVRDGYTKYKKQLRSSTGSSRKNVSYTWASQLEFLDSFNVSRASFSNVSLDPTQLSRHTQTRALDSDNLQHNPPPLPSTSSQALPPESPAIKPTTSSKRVYRKRRTSKSRRNEDDAGRLQLLNTNKKKKHDVIDNLFLSYADTFKKFPPREQAIVKLEIAKLFSNTELQLLNYNNPNKSHPQCSSVISDDEKTEVAFIKSSPQNDDCDITQLSDET